MTGMVKIRWAPEAAVTVMRTGIFVNRSHAIAIWGRLTGKDEDTMPEPGKIMRRR